MTRKKKILSVKRGRRKYTDDFKEEAMQMLLDGHIAAVDRPRCRTNFRKTVITVLGTSHCRKYCESLTTGANK